MVNEEWIFKVDDDVSADEAIAKMQELEDEVRRLELVTEKRIERLKESCNQKTQGIKEEILSLEGELKAYFSTVKTKDTKTQRKYTLPSGVLVEKKQEPQYKCTDSLLVSWAKDNKQDYIKVEEKIAWADLKKDILIVDGKAVYKETGEVLDGIEVVEREPKFIIK